MSEQGRRKGKKVHTAPKFTSRPGPGPAYTCKHDRVASELLRKMVDDEVERIKEDEKKLKLLQYMAVVNVQMKDLESEVKNREVKEKKNLKERDYDNVGASTKDDHLNNIKAEDAPVEQAPAENANREPPSDDAPADTPTDEDDSDDEEVAKASAPADDAPADEAPDNESTAGEAPDDIASSDEEEEDDGIPIANPPRFVPPPFVIMLPSVGGPGATGPATNQLQISQPDPQTPAQQQSAPTLANLAAAFADMVSVETAERAAEAYVDPKNN